MKPLILSSLLLVVAGAAAVFWVNRWSAALPTETPAQFAAAPSQPAPTEGQPAPTASRLAPASRLVTPASRSQAAGETTPQRTGAIHETPATPETPEPPPSREPGTPEEVYERGFRLLTEYSSPAVRKLQGWRMLEQAARDGHLVAKITVAGYDAGFITLAQPDGALPLIKPNTSRALEYLRDTAEDGHAGPMLRLALLYSSGIGEPRNERESPHNLLLTAAGNGNQEAMVHLSNRYLFGHGAPADPLEAARWRYLASVDNPTHRVELVDSDGNPKRQSSAPLAELARFTSLFIKAAEQNDPAARADLARSYAAADKKFEPATLLRPVRVPGH